MRWGLIPFWAKDPSVGYRMINARCETVATSGAFKHALRHRRCLIPADGFYEWKKEAGSKIPMRILLKGGEAFTFAGLWETWKSPEGQTIESCIIITCGPNELMAPIHDRMPVILPEKVEATWLDSGTEDPAQLLPLLVPYPSERMKAYRVSPLVNSPKTDSPACIVPA